MFVILILIETKSVTSDSGVIVCKSSDNIVRSLQEIQNPSFPESPIFRFCFALNLNVKYIDQELVSVKVSAFLSICFVGVFCLGFCLGSF